jgi:hypothetical protein
VYPQPTPPALWSVAKIAIFASEDARPGVSAMTLKGSVVPEASKGVYLGRKQSSGASVLQRAGVVDR